MAKIHQLCTPKDQDKKFRVCLIFKVDDPFGDEEDPSSLPPSMLINPKTNKYPNWVAPIVMLSFLFFDVSKILAERVAQKGTSLNPSFLNVYIYTGNTLLAGLLTIYFLGFKNGLSHMFDWEVLKGYALPALFFSSAQLFNLLQNAFLSSSTRKVFSNLRIPLTGCCFGCGVSGFRQIAGL